MSTKTTFKRVALATVAAMGFGLLSVVPANATASDITGVVTLGTLPTGQAVAGTAVTVSPTIATNTITTDATGAKFITTANVSTAPAHSALTGATPLAVTSSVATKATTDTNGTVAAAVATGNSTTTGAKITFTQASATAAQTAAVMGSFSFTPDVAGYYVLTLTQTSVVATSGTGAAAVTTATLTVGFTVSGGALIQIGASAAPKTTGTQVTGRDSTAVFFLPQNAATTSRYKVSSTGATITGVFAGADATNAVDATTYTDAATGIVKNDGTGYAQGVTYQPARAGTAPASGAASTNSFAVRFTSAVAGAGTVLVQSVDAATGVLTTVGTVTVEFGAVAVVSPSLSTVFIGTGNARPSTVETTAIRIPSTAAVALSSTLTSGATIAINIFDTSGTALVNQAVTATITGSGLITLANDQAGSGTGSTGLVRTASLTATTMANSSKAIIGVTADGTRGVGTITITAGGVTIATKTVTFYGAVATLTATQGVGVMGSGRTATSTTAAFTLGTSLITQTPAEGVTAITAVNIRIVAKDVDGNVVPLAAAPTAVISDALVIGAVTISDCAGQAATTVCAAGAGNYIASTTSAIGGVSGAKATVTFQTPNPAAAGTFISTAALPFSLGGTALGGTVTMTLNKASYEPGERMVITYTAKDAAGNPVRDWSTAATPTANKSLPGLAGGIFVAGSVITGDEAGELVYAPVSPGTFIITLGTGTATGAEITATGTVSDDAATAASSAAADAAAEATDAANAATDAANAAAEAADAATAAAQDAADAVAALSTSVTAMVADLRKQITALTNLVIKIQKKVKA
jgi:hypothetical protein